MKILPNEVKYLSKDVTDKIGKWSTLNCDTQRLIMGVAALSTQPLIDYNNKNVDKTTRNYSVARTILKIIVGTTVGVIVRRAALKWAKGNGKKFLLKNIIPNTKSYYEDIYAIKNQNELEKIAKIDEILKTRVNKLSQNKIDKLNQKKQKAIDTQLKLEEKLKKIIVTIKNIDEGEKGFVEQYIHAASNIVATIAVIPSTLFLDAPIMSLAINKLMPPIKHYLEKKENGGNQ
ncbi:MAG: hypothetical protein PHV68_04240 [Candidatus Gastranaerophilales bacterium]|nr:hypothetical protein [Candidatus Gastranaerophilales bacterium]